MGLAQPVLQAAKAALAAVIAWQLAHGVLELPQPFLAPYAAVFLVESTVYRSVRSAAQQVSAVGLGVLLAAGTSQLIASQTAAIGLVALVGLVLGRWRGFGSSGIWVGVTALLVISYGAASEPVLLVDRLIEIALGASIGLLVNAVLLPPIYLRRPQEATEKLSAELSELLRTMARSLRAHAKPEAPHDWAAQARSAESLVRQAEDAIGWSDERARLNLRRRHERRQVAAEWRPALSAIRSAWPHLRELTEAAYITAHERPPFAYPDPESRRAFAAVLDDLAETIARQGQRGGSLDEARRALDRAEAALHDLERRIEGHPHISFDSAVGLASMVLPANKVAAELRI